MADLTTPSFLENCSPDDMHSIGLAALPPDIDMSEGGHAWNLTRSPALIASFLCEYILPNVISLINPETAFGTYLDDQAKIRAMKRRAATAASGEITITGTAGAVIPSGSLFVTSAINNEPSTEYRTTEDVTIPESGSVTVSIECTKTGIGGNTAANTIIHVGSKLTGIKSVTNEAVITGGTEEEDDESLQARITEYDQSLGDSFVGSPSDYKRWAESVNGVGAAEVIPAQDTSGLVTIVLLDANGDPANEKLRTDVYNHIMAPDNQGARLAPTNASLSVVAPETVTVAIKATVELKDDATIESVSASFLSLLMAYLPEAMQDGEIRYSRITRELSKANGVYDYADVQIGVNDEGNITYGTSNIAVSNTKLPVITAECLLLTAGTV